MTLRAPRQRDPWPRELWWCENDDCNEPTCEDPCQFCGNAVVRYRVVPEGVADRLRGELLAIASGHPDPQGTARRLLESGA